MPAGTNPMQVKQDYAMADKQTQARNLAALEAAIAQELTTSRTMTLAVGSAPDSGRLTPTVEAWLHDWQDYHAGREPNPILKACLPVAINQVSPQRIAAAVWHLTRQEWDSGTDTDAPAELQPAAPGALAIQCPESPHPKHKSQIVVNGQMRTVPARLACVLAEIAGGATVVKYRPETAESMQELVPEIVSGLTRDWTRKVIGKHASYAVAEWVAAAFRVRNGDSGAQSRAQG